jgi:hypothetical protein
MAEIFIVVSDQDECSFAGGFTDKDIAQGVCDQMNLRSYKDYWVQTVIVDSTLKEVLSRMDYEFSEGMGTEVLDESPAS